MILSDKPRIQVSVVGGLDYVFTCKPFDKEGTLFVRQRTIPIFPEPVPQSGQTVEEVFLPYRHTSQQAPLGMGLKNTYDKNRVYDMNADARFPRLITLPRLMNTTTFPAGVTAVQFKGFCLAIGQLFMYGLGNTGETVLYWNGSNWADATLQADAADERAHVVGMCEHLGRVYAVTSGSSTPELHQSVDGTTWTDVAEVGFDSNYGGQICSDGVNLYAVLYDNPDLARVAQSVDHGVNWTKAPEVGDIRAETNAIINNIVVFGDGATPPARDVWFSTQDALFQLDIASTFTSSVNIKRLAFQHQESVYTGTLLVCPHGLLFTDGPSLFLGNFTGDGQFDYQELGPIKDAQLPLAKQGDITWIAYDSILDEIACGIGGLAASRNQHIMFYSFRTGLWSADMGYNSTANRASFAGIYSTETDGRSRLHFTRDNGVANDSEALYLDYISENPDVQTAATFESSGYITRSRFDGGVLLFKKCFLAGQYVANALTSTETLSVKFATDGGSLGSAQATTTTAYVQELATDGATNKVGTAANDIYDEITMARDSTTTLTPKIRLLGWGYETMGFKSDGTPLREFTFRISLDDADNATNENVESGRGALAALETLQGTTPLVKLAFGATFPVGSEVKVRLQPRSGTRRIASVQDQVDQPGGGSDGGGYEEATFREVFW